MQKQPNPALNSLAFLGPWWQPSSRGVIARSAPGAGASPPLDVGLDGSGPLRGALRGRPRIGRRHRCGPTLARGREHRSRGEPRGPSRTGGPWPHPLLAVDAHTIVTGSEETLRHLVARGGDAELSSGPMELLLKKLSPGGDLAVMVDLSPPQTATRNVPANLLDVWPAGKSRWHLLCETPLALGLSVQSADQRRCELGLVCNGETKAEKIRLDVEKLVPDAIQALPAHIAALKGMLPPTSFRARRPINTSGSWTTCSRPCALPVAIRRTASSGCGSAGEGRGSWSRQPRPSRVRRRCGPIGWPLPGAVDESNHRGLLSGLLQLCEDPESAEHFPRERPAATLMLRAGDALELDRGAVALSRSRRLACRAGL